MKKIFNFVLLCFPFLLLAQSETTLDEYNYLTKGYAYQKELGLDGGKQGYQIQPLFTASNGVEFRSLIKMETEVKGVLAILGGNTRTPIYLGLPTNSSSKELKGVAENDAREKLNLNQKEAFDQAILELAMFQLNGDVATNYIGETEKNLKGNTNSEMAPAPVEKIVEEYSTVVPLKVDEKPKMTERSGKVQAKSTPVNSKVTTEVAFNERTIIAPAVVRGQHPKPGTVVIKMCIDIDGNVKTAKFTQRGSTTFNKTLRGMAIKAAKEAKFSKGMDPEECGTITFKFQ